MGPAARFVTVILAIAAMLAIASPAATAKKKKPKQVPLTVSVGTGTSTVNKPAVVPYRAEVSSIATCPGNTVAVGGGYFAPVVSAPLNAFRVVYVTESVRVGENQWQTRGVAEWGANGAPQEELTTEVYCLPRRGTITDVPTTTTLGGGNTDAVNLLAACTGKSRLLSGGFAGLQSLSPTVTVGPATESAPAGNAWSVRISRVGTGAPTPVTAHAYCYTPPPKKKKGKKAVAAKKRKKKKILGPRPLTVLTAAGTVPSTVYASSTTTTLPCAGHLRGISGGFAGPALGATSWAIFSESRLVGGAWRVTGVQGGSPSPPLPFTAFNDCA